MSESFSRTGIGRPIDLRFPSNRYVVGVSVLAGVGGFALGLVTSHGWEAIRWGATAGVAVFLAWAIGREIDPDRTLSAGLAAPLAGLGFLEASPALAACFLVLLVSRVLVRSTGVRPFLGDSAVVLAMAVYTATTPVGFPIAVLASGAMIADAALKGGSRRHAPALGVVALLGSIVAGTISDSLVPAAPSMGVIGWLVIGVGSAAGFLVSIRVTDPTSIGDVTGQLLDRSRLRSSRIAVVVMALVGSLWASDPAALAPVWAALVGTAGVSFLPGASREDED